MKQSTKEKLEEAIRKINAQNEKIKQLSDDNKNRTARGQSTGRTKRS